MSLVDNLSSVPKTFGQDCSKLSERLHDIWKVTGFKSIQESDLFLMSIISVTNLGIVALNLGLDLYSQKISCYSAA